MNLSQFVSARITEDEAVVAALPKPPANAAVGTNVLEVHNFLSRWNPPRASAECEAKRRIVEFERRQHALAKKSSGDYAIGAWVAADAVVRILALAYADHPDYREEWRP